MFSEDCVLCRGQRHDGKISERKFECTGLATKSAIPAGTPWRTAGGTVCILTSYRTASPVKKAVT